MRAGARAPQPSPLSPSPHVPPKPPFLREADLQPRERLLQRGKASNHLRDRVVELARLKAGENRLRDRKQPGDVTDGSGNVAPNLTLFNNQGLEIGYEQRPRRGVTFLLEEDRPSRDLDDEVKTRLTPGEGREGETGLNKGNGSHLSPFGHHPRLPTPPKAPPLPRSALARTRGCSVDSQAGGTMLAENQLSQGLRLPGCPTSEDSPDKLLVNHHHHHLRHHHAERVHNQQEEKVQMARAGSHRQQTTASGESATAAPSPRLAASPAAGPRSAQGRTLKAPSCIALSQQQQGPHPGSGGSPKARSARSRRTSSPVSGGGESRSVDAGDEAEPSHSTPARARISEPGQPFDYQRAARILNQASQDHSVAASRYASSKGVSTLLLSDGTTPSPAKANVHGPVKAVYTDRLRGAGSAKTKSAKSRREEGNQHHQAAEDQTEAEVVKVTGSALSPAPQRQHTQARERRWDSKNPSRFSTSLEMFKRRLRMNQTRFIKGIDEENDDDIIIKLYDASGRIKQTVAKQGTTAVENPEFGNHASIVFPGHDNFRFGALAQVQDTQIRKDIADPAADDAKPTPAAAAPSARKPQHVQTRRAGGQQTAPWSGISASAGGEGESKKDKWTMAGDWEARLEEREEATMERPRPGTGQAGAEVSEGVPQLNKDATEEFDVNSSASNTKGPESGLDYFQGFFSEKLRAPLPQVRTYVVEGNAPSAARPTGQGLDPATSARPLALTLQNVSKHNVFLQRRQERDRGRQRRGALHNKSGPKVDPIGANENGDGHPGWPSQSPDADTRMRRWLVDLEYQKNKDIQPLAVDFKIAVMPTA